jgi:hypothetical protein
VKLNFSFRLGFLAGAEGDGVDAAVGSGTRAATPGRGTRGFGVPPMDVVARDIFGGATDADGVGEPDQSGETTEGLENLGIPDAELVDETDGEGDGLEGNGERVLCGNFSSFSFERQSLIILAGCADVLPKEPDGKGRLGGFIMPF